MQKNHFLLLKVLKNTESAQIHIDMIVRRFRSTAQSNSARESSTDTLYIIDYKYVFNGSKTCQ